MNNLQQVKYKDENGTEIDASRVEVLGPYLHIADGFYNWTCGACGSGYSSRSCGWPIQGQVLICESCKKMNLLVRTDCDALTELARRKFEAEERDRELKRLKEIEKFNDDKLLQIKREILSLVEKAISSHFTAERHYGN